MSFAACAYIAGYVRKKVRQKDDPEHYTRVDPDTGELHELVPEFARMSRRPGIAREWISRYWSDVYPRDHVTLDGAKMKPPRYYDIWLEENKPDLWEEVRLQRYLDSLSRPTDWDDLETRRLPNAETIHQARVSLFNPRNAI